MWTNPLDVIIPQLRQDWANHIFWGGMGGMFFALVLKLLLQVNYPWAISFGIIFVVSALKKIVDYIKVGPPQESWQICVGKTFVTAVWPATILIAQWLG